MADFAPDSWEMGAYVFLAGFTARGECCVCGNPVPAMAGLSYEAATRAGYPHQLHASCMSGFDLLRRVLELSEGAADG